MGGGKGQGIRGGAYFANPPPKSCRDRGSCQPADRAHQEVGGGLPKHTRGRGGGIRNVRYLEWQNLVRRKFGTNSLIPLQNWHKIPRLWHKNKHTPRILVVIPFGLWLVGVKSFFLASRCLLFFHDGFWMLVVVCRRLLDGCC